MAVRNLDELLQALAPLSEGYPDLQISLMEDLTDTLKALDATELNRRIAELEQAVTDKDNEWRERYKARFLSGEEVEEPKAPQKEKEETEDEETEEKKITVDDVVEKWKEEG